jgi:hypothetical protein
MIIQVHLQRTMQLSLMENIVQELHFLIQAKNCNNANLFFYAEIILKEGVYRSWSSDF